MDAQTSVDRERKKASAEMMVLAVLEERGRHGYDIARQIERLSDGAITFHVASLYTMLYRLEGRGLIAGRWLEKVGQRRRRFYRLTPDGRRALAEQRRQWREFIRALDRVAQVSHA
jgi:PadR family transcriptional regulator